MDNQRTQPKLHACVLRIVLSYWKNKHKVLQKLQKIQLITYVKENRIRMHYITH